MNIYIYIYIVDPSELELKPNKEMIEKKLRLAKRTKLLSLSDLGLKRLKVE